MKYIITGHKGQIGREFIKYLNRNKHKSVTKVDRRDKIHLKYLVTNDITKMSTKTPAGGADILFHLAANCKINKCIEDPFLALENVIGTYNILEFCRINKINKIVLFSSSRVLSEEENPYTVSKKYGEMLCKAYKKCYGIDYIIIRPSSVYGGLDKTGRLMKIWTDNARKDKPLEIYGSKDKTLCFTHIDDFINAMDIILQKGQWNREYNIFGFENKLTDVADEIIKQTNSESKVIFKNPEKEQPQRVSVEDKYLSSLGYKPKININEGIKKYLKTIK